MHMQAGYGVGSPHGSTASYTVLNGPVVPGTDLALGLASTPPATERSARTWSYPLVAHSVVKQGGL
jgi:hypothetical protein